MILSNKLLLQDGNFCPGGWVAVRLSSAELSPSLSLQLYLSLAVLSKIFQLQVVSIVHEF